MSIFIIRMQDVNIRYTAGTYTAQNLETAMLHAKLAYPDSEVIRVRQWIREQYAWVTVFQAESIMQ